MDILDFLLGQLASCLTICCIFTIPIYPRIKMRWVIVLFSLCVITYNLFVPLLGQFSTYIILLQAAVVVILAQKSRLRNLLVTFFAYILSVVLNYLLLALVYSVWGISSSQTGTLFYYSYLLLLVAMLLGYRVLLYSVIKIQNYILPKKVTVCLSFNFFLLVFIIVFLFSWGERIGYTYPVTIFSCLIFALYAIASSILCWYLFTSAQKEARLQHQLKEYETLQEYTGNLEEAYRQMRGFRHDYANVLASITCFLQDGEYQQLEDYLNAHLLPQKASMEAAALPVGRLYNMQLLELKSLIYTKLIRASSENIPVHLDIPRPVTASGMDPVILVRILGIFLDNALDAAGEQENPSVFLGILQQDDTLTINVKNPCSLSADQLGLLSRPGFTTKEGHTGIGLSTVKELTAPMDNVFWNTRMEEGMLVQELQITGLSV